MNLQYLTLWALAFLAATTLKAENWPQFRGPTGQGLSAESGVPLHWSDTENVAWRTPLPGQSWSSPIVWNQRVFATTATDGGATCRVLSLDARTGDILWDKLVHTQMPGRKEKHLRDADAGDGWPARLYLFWRRDFRGCRFLWPGGLDQ